MNAAGTTSPGSARHEPPAGDAFEELAASADARLLRRTGADRRFRIEYRRSACYDVVLTDGPVFDASDATLADALEGRPAFIVVDRRVDAIHGPALRAYAATCLRALGVLPLHAAEATKSLAGVEAVCAAAYAAGLPRDGVLVGVGGGVVLDQVGVAASLYRRGVRYARVPTTLVGIVDVGVGIKHAVNAEGRKSWLGAFYPAYVNVADLTFLASVPAPALACGLAETAKMALIRDARLFVLLEDDGPALLASRFQAHASAREVIGRAQATMLAELHDNLHEENRRRAVDLGHTFSPLLEVRTSYAVAHGEAVGIDLVLSTAIAVELGLCDAPLLPRLIALLRSFGLRAAHAALTVDVALDAIAAARANRDGALNLVVPAAIGSVAFVQEAGAGLLAAAMARVDASLP